MNTLNSIILVLHILSGYLALTSGAIVLFGPKGNKTHRFLGIIFFFSMLGVVISSIYLALSKNIPFLFYIGIFVFYQNYAGYKSVRSKSLHPDWKDILILLLALVNALLMIKTFKMVLVVFGAISLFLIYTDIKIYLKVYRNAPVKKLTWLSRHIGMMIGAYIGTLTAFLVVNFQTFQPYWIIWLAPTVLLVPLMRYWTWKYTKKPIVKSRS